MRLLRISRLNTKCQTYKAAILNAIASHRNHVMHIGNESEDSSGLDLRRCTWCCTRDPSSFSGSRTTPPLGTAHLGKSPLVRLRQSAAVQQTRYQYDVQRISKRKKILFKTYIYKHIHDLQDDNFFASLTN